MPLNVSKLREAKRTITFDFLGESVTVTYRLGAINRELAAWIREHAFEADGLYEWIERVVVSWDLTDDGAPVEPIADVLKEYNLPSSFLRAVQDAVYEDAQPKNLMKSGETSDDTSSPAEKSEKRRTGTAFASPRKR